MLHRILIILSLAAGASLGHDIFTGRCPTFKPMPGFEWSRFKDKRWYAVEKFDTTQSQCLTYTFQEDDVGLREVVQRSKIKTLSRVSLKNTFIHKGKLASPKSSDPADMIVRFELNFLGSASYVIMDTDYDSYALLCTCQDKRILFDVLTFHRRSCTILQGSPERDPSISEELHRMVNEQIPDEGGEPADHDFDIINHDNCKYEDDGKGLRIDVESVLGSSSDRIDDVADGLKTLLGAALTDENELNEYIKEEIDLNSQPLREEPKL